MKRILAVAAMVIPMIGIAKGNDDTKILNDIMVVSKHAGMCGVFMELIHFQEGTKMKNGDEFLDRFFATEFARLDTNPKEFMELCKKTTATYNEYSKYLEEQK